MAVSIRAVSIGRVSTVYSLHDWFPGGSYQPRITRFDNPLSEAAFPRETLPFGGHGGVQQRDAACGLTGSLPPDGLSWRFGRWRARA